MDIIDSHVHLYSAADIPTLSWTGALDTAHPLKQQRSVDDYVNATNADPNLRGFIFIETDRKTGPNAEDWDHVLAEIAFLRCIATGNKTPGCGYGAQDSKLLLAFVPWAPVYCGPAVLENYFSHVRKICPDDQIFSLIKGVRYLTQSCPRGTMTSPAFVSGLQWLAANNLSFDLTIDCHNGGLWQIQEACEMLKLASLQGTGTMPTVVVDHLAKPNLELSSDEVVESTTFQVWSKHMRTLASYPRTFLKLSGAFSEMLAQPEDRPAPLSSLQRTLLPWFGVILSAFGPDRILFGSDWPVCTAQGPGQLAWTHWRDLVAAMLESSSLSQEQQRMVWSGTAIKAYKLASQCQ